MHPGLIAEKTPDKAAYIMAGSGRAVSYGELDRESNRGAHLFRALGLERGDVIAIFMENNPVYFQLCWAAQRSGLYYVCISSYLTAAEIEYILADSGARVFITSAAKAEAAAELAHRMPGVDHRFMVEGAVAGYQAYEDAIADLPATPIADQSEGSDMLYSSGTTGRPKGVKAPLKAEPFGTPPPFAALLNAYYGFGPDTVYLSPAPLYHAAPLRFNLGLQRLGGTSIVMERFDPEQALALIERYACGHGQFVPTMFVRMLKLPEGVRRRHDVTGLAVAIHAAAPCPTEIKRQMIDWWGPVITEYYAGTEGNGFCAINSAEWLAHPGSVGKALIGQLHILDDAKNELPVGEAGTIYFADGPEFSYHNDPKKTAESRSPDGWSTLGDVGYLDDEGYLYLTDRKAHMIITGGVNVYPQEVENLLVTHPKVLDVAVIGVPNAVFGEEVKAVVQPMAGVATGPELAAELIEFCRRSLSSVKCPRSVDFEAQLPRHDNGKLLKRLLKDRYWANPGSTAA